MEDKICVSTYESCGSFKIYSIKSFKSLDDLREQLKTEGIVSIGLAQSGWYDDYEHIVKSGIKIADIQMDHVAWIKEKTGEHRYLALYR